MAINPILQRIVQSGKDQVPIGWRIKDAKKFGLDWELFDYQKNALENISAALYFHYSAKDLFSRYRQSGLGAELEKQISILPQNENHKFLADFYGGGGQISFEKFANRAAFWMATGSGKTLVMVKLIALLAELTQRKLIPPKDILVLAPKDEILDQIKEHIEKFNKAGDLSINFRNLKEWERVKNQQSVFGKNEVNVFYYRADNIGDKETIAKKKDGQRIDYKSVLNGGNWHLILDEAHKGEKEFSKRQQYYMVLAQNGFLFNFSATFTDPLDLATAVFEYNLSSFLKDGYGKKIYLADLQFLGGKEDFTDNEKKNIIAQSLIMLALAKIKSAKLRAIDKKLYHSPLLMTLAHSVNTEDADLKVFFNLLAQIARNEFDFNAAKKDLTQNLASRRGYLFNLGDFDAGLIDDIRNMRRQDFFEAVFNAGSFGNIQVVKFNDNPRELAFQVKGAKKYFMLIVASDVVRWEENVLENYEMGRAVEKSFFDDINSPARGDINILLGSRIFAEGWDTNRPNIINFINIGVSNEAQKYVLQSIGRGVRVEPVKNKRRRFDYLDKSVFGAADLGEIEKQNKILETLSVFATNKEVVKNILAGLESKAGGEWKLVKGIKKNPAVDGKALFLPIFRNGGANNRPFEIGRSEYAEVAARAKNWGAKILLLKNGINLRVYNKIMDPSNFIMGVRRRKNAEEILQIIDNYFNKEGKVLDRIKILEGEICHFNKIETNLDQKELAEIEKQIMKLLTGDKEIEKLKNKLREGNIGLDEYTEVVGRIGATYANSNSNIDFDYKELESHYYLPILSKLNSDHFRHIIKNQSEINFLQDLKIYLKDPVCRLNDCEWWYFSKIEENADRLAIPYFDGERGDWRDFYPDFIFWLKFEGKYYLKFIDPKGIEHIGNPAEKIAGFEIFAADFEKLKDKKLEKAELFFYNHNVPSAGIEQNIRDYYTDDFKRIFSV